MTLRQRLLRRLYPLIMLFQKRRGGHVLVNNVHASPSESFYALKVHRNDGSVLPMDVYRNRKVLVVNTASDCGYTAQYRELQALYDQFADKLAIIAFPSNEFKAQEKGSDSEIAEFCKRNYGVSFPIALKSGVKKGSNQNEVFEWLTCKDKNGWNVQEPEWNFSKYLINEQGLLTHYFGSGVSPLSDTIIKQIKA